MVGQKYKRGDLVLYTDGYYGNEICLVVVSSEEDYKIIKIGNLSFLIRFDGDDRKVRDWPVRSPYVYSVRSRYQLERNSIKLEKSYFGPEAIKYINQVQEAYFKSEFV